MNSLSGVLVYKKSFRTSLSTRSRTGRNYKIFDLLSRQNIGVVIFLDSDDETVYTLALKSQTLLEKTKKVLPDFCGANTLISFIEPSPIGLHVNPLHTKPRLIVQPSNYITIEEFAINLEKALSKST